MKKFLPALFLFVSFCLSGPLLADAEPYTEGKQYEVLDTPQPTGDPSKVEVLEAFWYGCPHCFNLEEEAQSWLKQKADDVEFVRLPAIPSKRWEWYAEAFYTAEVLGISDKIHVPLFEAIHVEKNKLADEDSMAEFFAQFDVSKDKFLATLKSFSVVTKVNQARQLTRRYGITSVPALIVNGKYLTTGRMAGTSENMFAVVDYLVEKERSMLQKTAGANP